MPLLTHVGLVGLAVKAYDEMDGRVGSAEYIRRYNATAFRGTGANRGRMGWFAFLRDLSVDRKFLPYNDPVIGRHPRGMMYGAKAIIEELDFPEDHDLGGHSLGAAYALLVGEYLAAAGNPPRRIVVCGCPRIGELKHLKACGVPITSYIYRSDIVTKVPPVYDPAPGPIQLAKPRRYWSIRDHDADGYEECLKRRSNDA